jgi:hypothetical protein
MMGHTTPTLSYDEAAKIISILSCKAAALPAPSLISRLTLPTDGVKNPRHTMTATFSLAITNQKKPGSLAATRPLLLNRQTPTTQRFLEKSRKI